jgi:uridine phosphorylase
MKDPLDWHSRAARPEMEHGMQYHIRCKRGDVAKYVLLPGDPERVDAIASQWSEHRKIADFRGHRTFTGRIGETEISCCSTVSGSPSAINAFEELAELGADTFLRVGSTGAIQEHIALGDLIISAGAMRHDGTSQFYVDQAYPAFASYDVVAALVEACEEINAPYHVGVSCTTASWYCGQGRPGFGGYTQSFVENKIPDLQRARVLNFDMESAAIFTLANLYGLRAGTICTAIANRVTDEFRFVGMDNCTKAANLAVTILHSWDQAREARKKRHFYPGLLRLKTNAGA